MTTSDTETTDMFAGSFYAVWNGHGSAPPQETFSESVHSAMPAWGLATLGSAQSPALVSGLDLIASSTEPADLGRSDQHSQPSSSGVGTSGSGQ